MTIPDRLKEARAALGLTQREFAAQSGVSARGYQGYEDGRSVPGGEAIAGFVSVGINANWLLTGEGPMLLEELQRQTHALEEMPAREAANEPPTSPESAQPLDLELLQGLMEMIEEELEERDIDLTPRSKARVLAILYDLAIKTGGLDESVMDSLLDLAA